MVEGVLVDRPEFRDCKRMFAIDWQLDVTFLRSCFLSSWDRRENPGGLRLPDHYLP